MKANLSDYRQSPRKVGLVAGLIRGKTVAQARAALKFANKRAALPMSKLLESAVSNAKNAGVSDVESLKVKEIRVDKGMVLKRIMPRARGSASRINKRSSHVSIVLAGHDSLSAISSTVAVAESKPAKEIKKVKAAPKKAVKKDNK